MVTAQERLVEMKPLNVIVVEDSEDDLMLIELALKKTGYDPCYTRVETAAGLKEALADAKWQLVLSDPQHACFPGGL
jgi:CheY-like chemotaxis protein